MSKWQNNDCTASDFRHDFWWKNSITRACSEYEITTLEKNHKDVGPMKNIVGLWMQKVQQIILVIKQFMIVGTLKSVGNHVNYYRVIRATKSAHIYLSNRSWLGPKALYLIIKLLKCSPTWSYVSLPRPTTSSGWKLIILCVCFGTKHLQILMFKRLFLS